MLNIGWSSTGRDEAARQLLEAVQDCIGAANINGRISFVSGDREPDQTKESDLFFDLDRNALFRPIRYHELARGFPLITSTLQSLRRDEISIRDERVTDPQRRATSRYNLTHQVGQEMKEIWT